MAQKKWLGLLFVLPVLAMNVANQDFALNQETRKIEKHNSRWNYPEEVVVRPGQTLHIVEKGDTLWDLGQKYLGNPYAWPQIWELNKWIEDPHWIYPGNPLIISTDGSVIGLDVEPDMDIAGLLPDSRVQSVKPSAHRIGYAYAFQDFLQLPYLAPKGANAHYKDLGAIKVTGYQKEDRHNLSKGDVIYLGAGKDRGLQIGDRMVALKTVQSKLIHPDDKLGLKPMGDVVQHAAILRVLSVHAKNAEAVIEDTLDGVEVGDHATAFVDPVLIETKDAEPRTDIQEPIPLNTVAKIVYGRNGASYFSIGSLVLIDKGSSSGYQVGDILLSVRSTPLHREGSISQISGGGPQTNKYLGQLLVVRIEEDSATCLVIATKSEMTLGDVVTK